MTDGLVEKSKRPKGSASWHRNRLISSLRLIAFLPTKPGVTLDEIIDHVDMKRRAVYALIDAIRGSEIRIHTKFRDDGRKLFYLARQDQHVIDKLLGVS